MYLILLNNLNMIIPITNHNNPKRIITALNGISHDC
nr:MAG TPA: hypothetical protein [Bacteriophage sp.]